MAFYSKQQIHSLVPRVLEVHDDVIMQDGLHGGELGKLVKSILEKSRRLRDERYKVFLLSPADDPSTLCLEKPIPNDRSDRSGKPSAFTMGHRYVSSESLLEAKTTSDIS